MNDVRLCIVALIKSFKGMNQPGGTTGQTKLNAVRQKYAQPKFLGVSRITPKEWDNIVLPIDMTLKARHFATAATSASASQSTQGSD
jgi:hypothetical protein